MTTELLAAAQHAEPGQGDDIDVVFRRTYRPLLLLAAGLVGSRAAAEDVVQDVFEGVMRGGVAFAAAYGPEPYLRRAVVNRCRSVHRRRLVRARYLARQPLEPPLVAAADDGYGEHTELLRALARLSHAQREVLVLRFWGDLPFDEIAELLGKPASTVRSLTARAVRALATILEGDRDD